MYTICEKPFKGDEKCLGPKAHLRQLGARQHVQVPPDRSPRGRRAVWRKPSEATLGLVFTARELVFWVAPQLAELQSACDNGPAI